MKHVGEQTKEAIRKWMKTPVKDRTPWAKFRREVYLSPKRFKEVLAELKEEMLYPQVRPIQVLNGGLKPRHADERILADPDQMKRDVILKLFNEIMETGNHQAAFRLSQLMPDWIAVEKKEITHKIDGAFIAESDLRARRELGDTGFRMAEVSDESRILRPDLRLPSGQGEDADSKVPAVGTSVKAP